MQRGAAVYDLTLHGAWRWSIRGAEGKDGYPLNEARMLGDAIMESDGVLKANSTIKYKAEKSVAGIEVGQAAVLDAETFGTLTAACVAEIGKRFP